MDLEYNSYTIGLQESVSVSTTHSLEFSLASEAGFEPFGVGVKFTTSIEYVFSLTKETSTSLSYGFNLKKDDTGYIGMVNAQISAKVISEYCNCKGESDVDCVEDCYLRGKAAWGRKMA
ncbi:hypothetical protein BG003_010795 [Podila horticola]|nr:hypothetical protein BG003_010795 [Podila horticola]